MVAVSISEIWLCISIHVQEFTELRGRLLTRSQTAIGLLDSARPYCDDVVLIKNDRDSDGHLSKRDM